MNGVVSYSGAPSTYSPQYESYQVDGYDGPGWDVRDALTGGIKETFKGGVSSSAPVQSLKSVSFGPNPNVEGLDVGGMARDASLLSGSLSTASTSGAVLVDELLEGSGE